MSETLVSLLDNAVEKYGVRIAIKSQITGESWTYSQLRQQALRVSKTLWQKGVGKGDYVAIISDNTPAFLAADYGVLYTGAASVPIDQALRPENLLKDYLDLVKPKFILAEEKYIGRVNNYANNTPLLSFEEAFENKPCRPDVEIAEKNISTIIFSSGTSAQSERAFKAVELSHGNIASNIIATEHLTTRAERIDGYSQGVYLTGIGKQWHSFEYMVQKAFLNAGCLLHFTNIPSFRKGSAAEINPNYSLIIPKMANWMKREIERGIEKPKGSKKKRNMLYAFFKYFLKNSNQFNFDKVNELHSRLDKQLLDQIAEQMFYKRIRKKLGGKLGKNRPYFIGGSAPLPLETQLFFYSVGLPIYQGYGLTETSPVISVNVPEDYRFGSSGRLISGVEVMIADEDYLKKSAIRGVGDGEEGLILVKGPNVFPGYLKDSERTRKVFIEGWFNTGDIGHLERGFIHVTGRDKDIICTLDGEKVFSTLVETYYAAKGLNLVLIGNNQKNVGALIIADEEIKEQIDLEGQEIVIERIYNQLSNAKEKFNVDFGRTLGNIGLIFDFDEHPELMTNTMKIRRRLFEKVYAEQIKKVCSKGKDSKSS